jgi:hypothetical protein
MGSSTLLGPDHPLARADSRLRLLRSQLAVTVVLAAVSVLASTLLGAQALRVAVGAAVVSLALAGCVLLARASLRERAFELIAGGREELPLPAVESERERLSDRGYRRRLARTLDVITSEPDPRRDWWTPLAANRDAVHGAQPELAEIARLLRELPDVRARGVALVTRLVRDGATSPLYQGPAPRLREELGRIRHVLNQR